MTTKIAIFASGKGSNADNIIRYFKNNRSVTVQLIIYNNRHAGVCEVAQRHQIDKIYLTKKQLLDPEFSINILADYQINLIILAGFLQLIPNFIISKYPSRVINIHPALLPKYGGKGMFGLHVHQKVKVNRENQTGITIHYVNDQYDAGEVIFQAKCSISTNDSISKIAQKVQLLERYYYPRIIEQLLKKTHDS